MKDPSIQISDFLNSIKFKCQVKDKYIADKVGLSCSELNCIKQFLSSDNLSVKYIAEKLNITSGGVTRILGNLEDEGILKRKIDIRDRRGIVVSLTPKGKELIVLLALTSKNYYNELFSGMDEEDKYTVMKGLELLDNSWEKLLIRIMEDQ